MNYREGFPRKTAYRIVAELIAAKIERTERNPTGWVAREPADWVLLKAELERMRLAMVGAGQP